MYVLSCIKKMFTFRFKSFKNTSLKRKISILFTQVIFFVINTYNKKGKMITYICTKSKVSNVL